MKDSERYSTFSGFRNIATGDLEEIIERTYDFLRNNEQQSILIFDNKTGKQIDFNFDGTLQEVMQNNLPPEPKKGPGRPRLGVVNGEISLLPRHWEWLQQQPQNASASLRRLIESAVKNTKPEDEEKQSIDAAGKFMWAIAGNLIGFEEASRALYSRKWIIFDMLTASWPDDVRNHLGLMLKSVRNPFSKNNIYQLKTLSPLKDSYEQDLKGRQPWELNAASLASAIAQGRLNAVEAVESCIARINSVNGSVNAVTAMFTDQALEAAAETDRRRAAGEQVGPLAGVPFTVKENLDVAGYPTTNGIPAMKDATAAADCPVVKRLRAAGAIPVGHTNMPDLSLRFHTKSQLYGATVNPWSRALSPGGSSGGEGVALATGMSALGVGNDAGGSVRIPALFNGVAALKPSFGRFPCDRSVGPRNSPLASQQIPVEGFLARSVADLHLACQIAAGPDSSDPRAVPAPLSYEKPGKQIKIAVVSDPGNSGVAGEVERAVDKAAEILVGAGYAVERKDLPFISEITDAYGKMIMTEFYHSLPMLKRLLGPEGQKYIEFSMEDRKPTDLAGYLELTAMRQGFQREWAQFFDSYALVLGPVFTMTAVPPDYDIKGFEQFREVTHAMRLCSASSFIGVPAVTVPVGIDNGVPQGVQLIAGMFREDLCLEAAAIVESATGVFTPINPR